MFAQHLFALTVYVTETAAVKMKKTKHLTFCALMVAISIVILLLGGITQILDLTAVVICAIIIFVVFEELRYSALLVYGATAVLTFFLLAKKEIAVEYVIFAIYPILKPLFEKAGKALGAVIKFIFMSAMSVALTLLFRYVFMSADIWYMDLVFCIGLIACYFLFDIAINRFRPYYHFKLRHQLRIDRFFH